MLHEGDQELSSSCPSPPPRVLLNHFSVRVQFCRSRSQEMDAIIHNGQLRGVLVMVYV